MNLVASWLVGPIEYRLWLGVLAALVIGTTVLAALRLRAERDAPTPMTCFLVDAPKALGTLALLLSAFAFVLEVDVTAVNRSWFEQPTDGDWLFRIFLVVRWGAGIAAFGFVASFVLGAFLPGEKDREDSQ